MSYIWLDKEIDEALHSLKNCRSMRICSFLNRLNRDTTVYNRLIIYAFSWPYMVKWRDSGRIINSLLDVSVCSMADSPVKYSTTRKNTQPFYTPKHLIGYIYSETANQTDWNAKTSKRVYTSNRYLLLLSTLQSIAEIAGCGTQSRFWENGYYEMEIWRGVAHRGNRCVRIPGFPKISEKMEDGV